MALHEVQVAEGIVYLEYEVFLLRETLNFLLENVEISNIEGLNMPRLKRDAYRYIKDKYPDEDLRAGDWID